MLHYQFETIHPFEDGNGRIGRLLIPLYLMAHNVIDRPVLYLSPYFERRRDDYVDYLKRISTHGDWETWLLFFVDAVEQQAQDSLQRVLTVERLRQTYRDRAISSATTKATVPAVDVLMEKVVFSVEDVRAYAGCSYNTAKAAIANIVELGILQPLPNMFPQRWMAHELVDLVYQS